MDIVHPPWQNKRCTGKKQDKTLNYFHLISLLSSEKKRSHVEFISRGIPKKAMLSVSYISKVK